MTLISAVIGLFAAVVVYLVLTAVIVFPHSVLVFALVAIVVFLAVAFSNVGARFRL